MHYLVILDNIPNQKNAMKKIILLSLFTFLIFISCSDDDPNLEDDNIIEVLLETVDRGAVLRTLEFTNSEFDINNLESRFSVNIEEQDEEDGDLLRNMDVLISFKDNSIENGIDLSTDEVFYRTVERESFSTNSNTLPQTQLEFSFNELLTITGVNAQEVSCGDQFTARLVLNLTDDRSFSTADANSNIISFQGFFSSPYCYTINVVNPISPELFVGSYFYESVFDGPFGPSFDEPQQVEIQLGHSPNVRVFEMKHIISHPFNEPPYPYEFSILCDRIIMEKNQLVSLIGTCGLNDSPALMGPGEESAPVNIDDDSVFELWFDEGFDGWDGGCGFGTAPSRIRFSRQ